MTAGYTASSNMTLTYLQDRHVINSATVVAEASEPAYECRVSHPRLPQILTSAVQIPTIRKSFTR